VISAFGVQHTISKQQLYIVPRSPKEQRKSRAKGAARGAATAGVTSAGITAALNPAGGRLKPAKQMLGIGGAIGGVLGATGDKHKRKVVVRS
jgi:hypothetical protein